jgi:UDP-glucose 4-epimerase
MQAREAARHGSMRVLVTGGNGFVGRPLVRLLYPGHTVHVIDSLRCGPIRFHDRERASFTLHQADIRDRQAVSNILAAVRPDVIVHTAAIHFIPECEENPELAVSTNLHGTVNLLAQCPPGCRFVFASSAAVYQPSLQALCEDASATHPIDVYGLTKAHAEDYVRYLARHRGFPAVIARLFNVVGPGETNPHVLPEIIAQLKAGRSRLRLGNTTSKRDFIYVSDAAAGFAALATAGNVGPGESVTVNLGTGRAYSIGEVLALLADITERKITVDQDDSKMRTRDNPLLLAGIEKAWRLFQWRPAYDLAAALRDTWRDPDLPDYLTRRYHE